MTTTLVSNWLHDLATMCDPSMLAPGEVKAATIYAVLQNPEVLAGWQPDHLRSILSHFLSWNNPRSTLYTVRGTCYSVDTGPVPQETTSGKESLAAPNPTIPDPPEA